MIISENEQLKREINMLKNLINHVVPQDVLQKPIENITDLLSEVSFLNNSTNQNQTHPVGKALSPSLHPKVDIKDAVKNKSSMPMAKIVCQESMRESIQTIEMMEEFENTTNDSNKFKLI